MTLTCTCRCPSGTFVRQCHESRPTLRANAGAGCLARCITWKLFCLRGWTVGRSSPKILAFHHFLGIVRFGMIGIQKWTVSDCWMIKHKLEGTDVMLPWQKNKHNLSICYLYLRHSAYKLPAVWGASRFTPNCQTPPTLNSGGKFEERANAETTFRDCLAITTIGTQDSKRPLSSRFVKLWR